MSRAGGRRRRAQFLPVLLLLMTGLVAFLALVWNLFGYQNTARVVIDAAIQSAAYAASQQTDPDALALGRWYIDPDAANAIARDYLAASLAGDDDTYALSVARGSATGLFRPTDPATLASLIASAITGDGDGVDVEVINPARSAGQTSERTLNGGPTEQGDAIKCTSGDYPEEVASSLLDGQCFDRPVVAIRVRLPVRQLGTGTGTITQTGFVSVGTDVQ